MSSNKIPHNQRNELWKNQLLSSLPEASFTAPENQVITGADGMPYFQLQLPAPNKPFSCFVIKDMIGHCLEHALGITISSKDNCIDWALTNGNLLNYYLSGEFYSQRHDFAIMSTTEWSAGTLNVKENTNISSGEPSLDILPAVTRNTIKQYLISQGIKAPKALLILHEANQEHKIMLAFNFTPQNFGSTDHYNAVFQTLVWLLPEHYEFCTMNEKDAFDRLFFEL